ncbi:ATP-binding protein [Shimia sp. SDUM112013]|uniref:hybrid sensor histidine kinase/response regulator n=1 Tax=Shimia sp. SDUM112013 TaxID=3136160 RepID=UPI0032EC6909
MDPIKKTVSRFPLRGLQGAGLLAAGLSIGVIAALIFLVAGTLRQEIDEQASATSDTTHWSMAQTEVDLRRLHVAVLSALLEETNSPVTERSSLVTVRRQFDIFYSRVGTVAYGQQFEITRQQENTQEAVNALLGFLATYETVIDSGDVTLRQNLPQLEADIRALAPEVRRFSLSAIQDFASASDTHRDSVGAMLLRMALLTLALVAIFFVVVMFLLKLIRRSSRAEMRAAESSNHLQEVISTSIDAILAIGRDGRIIDYNGAAEGVFGYTRDEAIGALMSDLIIPEHLRAPHEAGMARYREFGEHRVVGAGLLRLEARRKDGTVFPVEVTISSATANGREIFVSYLRDISARVEAEQELIEARDKAVAGEKAKADLIAVMSHEMRTPLNGLIGTMDLFENTQIDSTQRKYLSAMETSAKLLLHHVNGVLSMSRADAGLLEIAHEALAPDDFLRELVASQKPAFEANGNTITYDARHAPPQIWTDKVKLLQVVLNLVANANKFTRDGSISVECDQLSDGQTVEFRVTDTGIGIAPENHDVVFEDFRTLDTSYGRMAEGSGLGLGISRRLVEAMGGSIGLESEPDVGSIFWIRLPVGSPQSRYPETPHAPREASEAAQNMSGLSVLLVEDNEINRLVAEDMLRAQGHKVATAVNGLEGVQLSEMERFDLILMDISMPELDGVAATDMIRKGTGPNRHTPIIALTAHALPEDQERFHTVGINATVVKPLSTAALNAAIAEQVAQDTTLPPAPQYNVIDIIAATKGRAEARALVETFINEVDEVEARLAAFDPARKDTKGLASLAHKCAGSASVLGCDTLRTHLNRLETALLETGDVPPEILQGFPSVWLKEQRPLRARLDQSLD